MRNLIMALLVAASLSFTREADAQLFRPYVAPQQYGYNFRPMGIEERDWYYRQRYFNRSYYMVNGRIYYGLPRW